MGNALNVVVFILKCWVLVFVMIWVRWTLPRLRIDQVMMTCLKYLLPISCFLLFGVSLWQVLFAWSWFKYPMAALWIVLFLTVLFKAFTTKSILPDTAVGVSSLWNTAAPTYPARQK